MTQPIQVRAELDPGDQAQLLRDVRAFSDAMPKALRNRIRDAAKPIGLRMIQEVVPGVPRRGGLAYRLAAARAGVSTRSTGVDLTFNKPRVLRYIERGLIPHPVFADITQPRSTWRWPRPDQKIRPGLLTDAFGRNETAARAAVERAVLDAAQTVRSGEAS